MRDILAACTAVFLGAIAVAAQQHTASPPGNMTDDQIMKSVSMAAPAAIVKDATIVALTADGAMRTVRKGSNEFTCMADNPDTPGPDSACADANAMAWFDAYLKKQTPPSGKVGFVYMLAGGTDASNTDPYAQKPTATNNWIKTGPHVMVVGAKGMMEGYPRDAKPDTSKPYVMWADTPYEHLMLPVK